MSVTPYYEDELVTLYHADVLEHLDLLDQADVMVTDPPYGMSLRSSRNGAFGDNKITGDGSPAVRNGVLTEWGDRPAVVFGRWSVPRPAGTRMVLTWEKGEHVGMGDLSLPWKPNTEEIYILGTGFQGKRTTSVLRHLAIAGTVGQSAKGTRHHPTEKPVSLMEQLIGKCPSGVIVDPFAGSGATLRAAKNLGRKAIGFEIEEKYCRITADRLAQEVLPF